jgi:hypothetical protein
LFAPSASFINTGLQPGDYVTLNLKTVSTVFHLHEAVKTAQIPCSLPTPG